MIFYVGANDYFCAKCGKHVNQDGMCSDCDYPEIEYVMSSKSEQSC